MTVFRCCLRVKIQHKSGINYLPVSSSTFILTSSCNGRKMIRGKNIHSLKIFQLWKDQVFFLIQLYVQLIASFFFFFPLAYFFYDTLGSCPKQFFFFKETPLRKHPLNTFTTQTCEITLSMTTIFLETSPLGSFALLLLFKLIETCSCHPGTFSSLSPLMDFLVFGNYAVLLLYTLISMACIF